MALIVTDALKFRESENDQFRRLSLSANFNTPVPVAQGGTGADNAADARTNLGLGSVATENVVPLNKGGTGATNAATALSNLGALPASTITSGTWTPKIYDYETYRRDMAPQAYIKIGRLYVLFVFESPFQSTTFNTMIQIRNSPCPQTWGGMVYAATVSGQGGTWTVQGSNSNIFLRPNYQGTLSGGIFQGVFFGIGD